MSGNFNSLYIVNLNLNFVSVTQPLTDHNFKTVDSVEVSEVSFYSNWNMPYMMKSKSQFSFLPQSVSFTHAGSQMYNGILRILILQQIFNIDKTQINHDLHSGLV